MKKSIVFSLILSSFGLKAQTTSIVVKTQESQTFDQEKIIIMPVSRSNSGLSFRKASNSQLAAIGCSLLGTLALRQAGKVEAASLYDKTADPTDNYFLAGVCFVASAGFEISYLHHFRQASKKLALEQEMNRLEKERIERKIQEIENQINK